MESAGQASQTAFVEMPPRNDRGNAHCTLLGPTLYPVES